MTLKSLRISVLVTVMLCVFGLGLHVNHPAQAQENLLQDPSFEFVGDYNVVRADENAIFGVPPAWSGWVTTTPRTEDWMNRVPNGFPHTGLFKIDGGRSLSISRGFATFTTAVFQTVTVPEDANLRGSARGFMERVEPSPNGGQFRVGIDPSGGSNPLDPGIVWSNWVTVANGWQRAEVEATANGTRATLFLFATQTQPNDPNAHYWDDAVLSVGGAGGTATGGSDGTTVPPTPVVPTPAIAPFVAPQEPQPDGSIVHIVASGDTINSIAVAYRVQPQQILDLNEGIGSGRFIQPGQRLIIRPPTRETDDEDEAAEEEATPEATAEDAEAEETPAEQVTESPDEPADETEAEAEATEVPATNTPTPQPTSTEPPPAPVTQVAQVQDTRPAGTALCVWMFEDANQNRIQEASEGLLAGGTIRVTQGETEIQVYETDGSSEPFCFEDVTAGDYIAQATAPEGYGLTTSSQLRLLVQEGVVTDARFGAAQGVEVAVVPPPDVDAAPDQAVVDEVDTDENNLEQILQISGLIVFALAGLVLVGGIGAALVLRGR